MRVMIPGHWTPYRRGTDHELIGYLASDDHGSIPLTVFGYPLSRANTRAEAVRVLEARGLVASDRGGR